MEQAPRRGAASTRWEGASGGQPISLSRALAKATRSLVSGSHQAFSKHIGCTASVRADAGRFHGPAQWTLPAGHMAVTWPGHTHVLVSELEDSEDGPLGWDVMSLRV